MSSRNRVEVPEAKDAMNRFKMEVASELGVPLTNGYNGNLTSAQNGYASFITESSTRLAT